MASPIVKAEPRPRGRAAGCGDMALSSVSMAWGRCWGRPLVSEGSKRATREGQASEAFQKSLEATEE